MAENWRVCNGLLACDFNGDKIGAVRDVSDDYCFLIDTWYLGLDKNLYIPFDAIIKVAGSKVYINAPKESIDHLGWERKPHHVLVA